MPALSTFVTSLTQDRYIPKVIENALDGNVLTMRLMRNQKTWNGGHQIVQPVNLEKYNQLGSYSGFDPLSTTQQNTRQVATFNPSQVYVSMSISGIQKAVNSGDAAVIDLIATEMEQRTRDFKDMFGDQVYSDGTGNSSKDILGILAAIDDGTSVGTYGNLSRSTYANWKATRTAQSGSLSLADIAADFDAAEINGELPTIMITTPAVFTIYEALLTPTVSHQFSMNDFRMTSEGIARVGGAIAANQGFRALTFRGIPFVADPKCTSGNIFTINENHLFFMRLPQPTGFTVESERDGFGWTGWQQPVNQDAVTGRLQWYGQLVSDSPRTMARRTGVTA